MKYSIIRSLAVAGLLAAATSCGSSDSSLKSYIEEFKTEKIVPLRLSESGLYGYLHHDGSVATGFVYKTASSFHDGLAVVTDSATSMLGYIDESGKWVIEPAYASATDFNGGLAVVARPDSCLCVIDTDGNVRFSLPEVVSASIFFDGISLAEDAEGSSILVSGKGEKVALNKDWKDVQVPQFGYVKYTDGGRKCVGRLNGLAVEPVKLPEGMEIEDISAEYRMAIVEMGGKYGLVDFEGNMVVNPRYKSLRFDTDDLVAFENDKEKYGWINTKGEEVIPAKYKAVSFFFHSGDGYAGVSVSGNKFQVIDAKGEACVLSKYDMIKPSWTPGVFLVRKDDKWGLADKAGNVLCDPQFNNIGGLASGMFAATSGSGKWGIIDEAGKYVGPIQYDVFDLLAESHVVAYTQRFDPSQAVAVMDKMLEGTTFDTNFGKLADKYGLTFNKISSVSWDGTVDEKNFKHLGSFQLTLALDDYPVVSKNRYSRTKVINSAAKPSAYSVKATFDTHAKAKAVYDLLNSRKKYLTVDVAPELTEDLTTIYLNKISDTETYLVYEENDAMYDYDLIQ